MRIVTDQVRIARGARLGKIGAFGGFGFLVVGMIVSLAFKQLSSLWIALGCLLLGMVVATVGIANMNRWVREPRADQALEQGLKGFDDQYRLYNYVLPAPHVLLTPTGITVLTALGQDGVIRYEGGKFRRNWSIGRLLRFMADEGLGRPFSEGDDQVRALKQFLESHGAGEGVDIQNVLVFYNPRAQLSVTDPPRPVVVPKGLKKALRKQAEGALLPAQVRRLHEVLDSEAS